MVENYPYNLFLTKLVLTPINMNNFEYIFSYKHIHQSILILFSSDINDFIKINKLDINKLKKFNSLTNISNNYFTYDLLNQKNIELFCKKLIYKKEEFNKIYNNINLFLQYSNNTTEFIYENPINYNFIKDDNILSSIKSTIHNNYKNNEKIDISLDILLQYKYINLSLPSCGLVTSILSNNVKTYINLINILINNNNIFYNINNDLPFQSLDLPNILTNILFKNIVNDELKNITVNILKNVEVKLKDIFYEKIFENNNNNNNNNINEKLYTINKEYIIPYDIYKNKIISLKSSKNIKNYKDLINHNNKLLFYTLNKIYNEVNGKENLKFKKYKNILAYYLFNIIRIVYNICKKYIDELDKSLTNITIANKNTFGKLNLKDAFDYTFLLSKSLYNFKLLLLNNFYHLFLPKRIDNGYYGMYKNNNNYFVIQKNSLFIGSNDNIYKNYPIQKFNEKDNIPFRFNSNNLFENFILNMKSNYDIYERNNKLEQGAKVFDENIMKYTNKLLFNYFKILKDSNLFNIFIIEKIIYFFKKKKSIPLELVEDFTIIYKKLLLTTHTNSNYFISSLTIKYEDIINKCKQNYLNYINNKTNIIIKEQYKLISIIYLLKSMFLLNMIKNLTKDYNLKRNILLKFNNIKKKYEKSINNKLLL